MAFSNKLIFHNWETGSTANGGGFNPANASFATDLTTDSNTGNTASPVVSSASYNFVAGDVGAWVFVQSGTDWTPGWYQIASVASNKATLSAAVGAAVLYGTSTTGRNYQRPNGLNTAAGVATVGTPTGGVWSVDYSQQTTAKTAFTDLVIDGTTNTDFTSAAAPVGVNVLGNIINVTGGTGFTVQRVEILSIPSGVIGRVDKSLGTLSSTGGTGNLGGAIGSSSTLDALTQALVAGNHVFVRGNGTAGGDFVLTATTTCTASAKGDTTNGRIVVEGFETYPGDAFAATPGARPHITCATNSVHLITLNDNDFWDFRHLKLTHTAGTTRGAAFSTVTSASTPLYFSEIICDGCLGFIGGTSNNTMRLSACEIKNCTTTTGALTCDVALYCYGCDIHDNAGDGIRFGTSTGLVNCFGCIIDSNAGIGINDTTTTRSNTLVLHDCLIVDNTSDGVKLASTSGTRTLELLNNVIVNNGGWGINQLDTQIETDANVRFNRNNAYGWPNTSGAYTGLSAGLGEITLTVDPFTNRASRDFSLNNTAGGGALLRAAGFPTTFPGGTTTNYRDVGPVQHQDSGSGGGIQRALNMGGGLV